MTVIREKGGIVNQRIKDGKTPTDDQLATFVKETVAKLKELSKEAPDHLKQRIMLPWAPLWDFEGNKPGRTEDKMTPEKLLDILKRIKDGLAQPAPGGGKGGGKARKQDTPGAEGDEVAKIKQFHGPTETEVLSIQANHIGRIVGPKGTTLKMIQEASECKIDIQAEEVSIVGPSDGMPIAVKAIKELCDKGFCSLAYGSDFQEQFMNIHPIYFSELIGKEGKVIRTIKEKLRVELSIPKTEAGGKLRDSPKKYKVGFAGKKEDVEKAKEVVSNIITYYHDDLTHPGVMHKAVPIEAHQTRFIIGKGGCESRHIQKSYGVAMYIPNELTVCQDLLLVGEDANITRAAKYIENAIIQAEERANSGGRGRGGDGGGGDEYWAEEEQEDWMGDYMYKRK